MATLGKLLLFRLDDLFPAHNVYSSSAATKHFCFKMIHKRFGDAVRYCAIGDGPDEEAAADFMRWPFARVALAMQAAGEGQAPEGQQAAQQPAQAPGARVPGVSVLALSGEQVVALALAPVGTAVGRATTRIEAQLHQRLASMQQQAQSPT